MWCVKPCYSCPNPVTSLIQRDLTDFSYSLRVLLPLCTVQCKAAFWLPAALDTFCMDRLIASVVRPMQSLTGAGISGISWHGSWIPQSGRLGIAGIPRVLAEQFLWICVTCRGAWGRTKGPGFCSWEKCYPISFSKRFVSLIFSKVKGTGETCGLPSWNCWAL